MHYRSLIGSKKSLGEKVFSAWIKHASIPHVQVTCHGKVAQRPRGEDSTPNPTKLRGARCWRRLV